MDDSDRRLLAGISDVYQRELYREGFLAGLARAYPASARRQKLQTLCEISVETRARLRPVLQRLGGRAGTESLLLARGRCRATSPVRRRWIDFIEALLAEVTPGIAKYEQLERLAEPVDSRELARATALQVSVRSFARLELCGRGHESLLPARALLRGHDAAVKLMAVAAG